MTKMLTVIAAVAAMALPGAALAHVGHDHAAADAPLMHAIYYGAYAAIGVAIFAIARKMRRG